jgi:putative FmdB family regulatory protein
MPIYEYRCAKCGAQKEILQRLNDAPLTVCPECGKKAMKKMVTAAGFQLKGTGWYATDFKDKPRKAPGQSDKGADKSADKGADKGSDKGEKAAGTPASGDAAKPAATTSKETSKKEAPKTGSAAPAATKTASE